MRPKSLDGTTAADGRLGLDGRRMCLAPPSACERGEHCWPLRASRDGCRTNKQQPRACEVGAAPPRQLQGVQTPVPTPVAVS